MVRKVRKPISPYISIYIYIKNPLISRAREGGFSFSHYSRLLKFSKVLRNSQEERMNQTEDSELLRGGYWAGKLYQMTNRQQREWRAALDRRDIAILRRIDGELASKMRGRKRY